MSSRANGEAAKVLHWQHLFPRPGGVPIVARHNVRHPDCIVHSHDFMELVLIAGGSGRHQSAAGERLLRRGDVIILRPGAWHGYLDCRALEIFNLAFGPELLHQELAWTLEDPVLSYLLVSGPLGRERHGVLNLSLGGAGTAACEAHLSRLCDMGDDDNPGSQHARRVGWLLVVLGGVAAGISAADRSRARPRGIHRGVRRGMLLFERDLGAPWSLDDLAEKVGLEKSYLIRQFRYGTGMPPMTYLARLRAERAAHLLVRTEKSIGEIGQDVGWHDPVYFARRFRAHFGMPASQYRKRFVHGG